MHRVTPERPNRFDPEIVRVAASRLENNVSEWLAKEEVELNDPLIEVLVRFWSRDGYEFARDLERYSREIRPNMDLADILAEASRLQDQAHREACKTWIEENNISPSFQKGDKVLVKAQGRWLHSDQTSESDWTGEVISNDRKIGKALVFLPALGSKRVEAGVSGFSIPWEALERVA